ncbi:hypothetical protein GQ42DRAFT_178401 [Ramicandelaber brevisporus]|nr:hypothetical protein GQ42DRAFT_178401 [Ramicandelaber brevisporus]
MTMLAGNRFLNPDAIHPPDSPDVAGMDGRYRLARDHSDAMNDANWIETRRRHLVAYEYACHLLEAKEWMESIIGHTLPPILQFAESLRNGEALAELAHRFCPAATERSIYRNPKLNFKHSDNINTFLMAAAHVGLSKIFLFELVDLYEARNLPKVVYCIHALSHFLAYQGFAEAVGNLVDSVKFSVGDLEAIKRDLEATKVTLPSFGKLNAMPERAWTANGSGGGKMKRVSLDETKFTVGSASGDSGTSVGKVYSEVRARRFWETQVDVIISAQSRVRRILAKGETEDLRIVRNHNLLQQVIPQLQANIRGLLTRRFVQNELLPEYERKLEEARREEELAQAIYIHKVRMCQAIIKGHLARRHVEDVMIPEYEGRENAIIQLQALMRGYLARSYVSEVLVPEQDARLDAIIKCQAYIRGYLDRSYVAEVIIPEFDEKELKVIKCQAAIRGYLDRVYVNEELAPQYESRMRNIKLVQAMIRGYLGRNEVARLETAAQMKQLDAVRQLQALARGYLARRLHEQLDQERFMNLIRGMQQFCRMLLARRELTRLKLERDARLESEQRDKERAAIIIQAGARGCLARRMLRSIREEEVVTARRELQARHEYYQRHTQSIRRVQHMFRAKLAGRAYRTLELGSPPEPGVMRSFQNHLADGDLDVNEELELERMRQRVVDMINSNLEVERALSDLEHKIAKLVKNRASIEEVDRLRKRHPKLIEELAALAESASPSTPLPLSNLGIGPLGEGSPHGSASGSASSLSLPSMNNHSNGALNASRGSGKAMSNSSNSSITATRNAALNLGPAAIFKGLDRASRRKVESYQHLFYLLQTQPEYLARLMASMNQNPSAHSTMGGFVESVVSMFGFAHDGRDEYLLLRLIRTAIAEELRMVNEIRDFLRGNPILIKLTVQYSRRPHEFQYLRSLLRPTVDRIAGDHNLSLSTNPVEVYNEVVSAEERRTGQASGRPYNVSAEVALCDTQTRMQLQENLRTLQDITDHLVNSIIASLDHLPYGIRYIARELYDQLMAKLPMEQPATVLKVVGHLVFYRFISPALIAPDKSGVVDAQVEVRALKNLAQVGKVLNQISVGREFRDEDTMASLNATVATHAARFAEFTRHVIDVPDPESHFDVDQYWDFALTHAPQLYINPASVFSMHNMVVENIHIVAPDPHDRLHIILNELGAVPDKTNGTSAALRGTAVRLDLKDRWADEAGNRASAEINKNWVEAKRLVLYILRIQSGSNLLDIIRKPSTDLEEERFAELLRQDVLRRTVPVAPHDPHLPPPAAGGTPVPTTRIMPGGMQDLQGMSFADAKYDVELRLKRLEAYKMCSEADGYRSVLMAIGRDLQEKHARRQRRRKDAQSLTRTIEALSDKSAYLNDQLQAYYDYIKMSLDGFVRHGQQRVRRVLPFTKQYYHLKELRESHTGIPTFGSFKYSAKDLHKKGVLVSIHGYSQQQFNRISITVSSQTIGVFDIKVNYLGMPVKDGAVQLLLDDLLELQSNNRNVIKLFDDTVEVNVNLLVFLINKKFFS